MNRKSVGDDNAGNEMKRLRKNAAQITLLTSVNGALRCIDGASMSDERAHEARKQLKRARSALRLLRSSLGDTAYRRDNTALRDASRSVSPVRDAKVLVDVLVALRKRYRRTLLASELAPLEATLCSKLRQARRQSRRASPALRKAVRLLKRSRQHLYGAVAPQASQKEVTKRLRKMYARARTAYEVVRASATPTSLHEWRKKTKYLYNAVDLLGMPDGSRQAIVGKRAGRLGDWLGEEHDLAVLSDAVKHHAAAMPRSVTRSLRSAIRDRCAKLQAKALRLGSKMYGRRPKKAIK